MIAWRALLLTFFVYHHVSAVKENERSKRCILLEGKSTQKEAERNCSKKGPGWGLPDSQTYKDEFQQILQEVNVPTVWLNLHKISFPSWTWVNGSNFTASFDPSNKYSCAGLTVQGERIRPVRCSERGLGFVCHLQECREKHLRQSCVAYEKHWYLIGCSSDNWHDARAFCKRRGGDLAVVADVKKQKVILNYIIEKKLYDICGWILIGLRREDWNIFSGNKDTSQYQVYWDIDQPKLGNCVVAKIDAGKIIWEARPCDEKHNVLCQTYNATPIIAGIKTENKEEVDIDTALLYLLEFMTFLTIILSLVFVIIYFSQVKSTDQDKTALLRGKQDARTIVIVSKAIEKWKKKHFDFENIHWLERRDKIDINVSGSDMETYITKAYQRLRGKGKLHIVCIDALQPDGTILDGVAEQVIKFLIDSIKKSKEHFIDAVCLPRFNNDSADPKKVLELLWELRNLTVVISAPHLGPCLPCTEVLSVGSFKDVNSPPTSKSDFAIKFGNDVNNVRQLGAATVAGITAALIETVKASSAELNIANWTSSVREAFLHCLGEEKRRHGICYIDVPDTFKYSQQSLVKNKTNPKQSKEMAMLSNASAWLKDTVEKSKDVQSHEEKIDKVKFNYEKLLEKKVQIKCALIRQREELGHFKGWNITGREDLHGVIYERNPVHLSKHKQERSSQFMKFLLGLLQHSGIQAEILQKVIQIEDVPIFDEDFDIDLKNYTVVLKKITCHVVYTHHLKNDQIENGVSELVSAFQNLRETAIVICPALAYERSPIPPNYPSDMVISVGYAGSKNKDTAIEIKEEDEMDMEKNKEARDIDEEEEFGKNKPMPLSKSMANLLPKYQLCGSTLDFICADEAGTKRYQASDPWLAAYNAVAVSIIVLINASALEPELEESTLNKLRKTAVMHEVLRHLCSHPTEHKMFEGWGYLDPWETIKDPNKLYALIKKCVPPERNHIWNGKNV